MGCSLYPKHCWKCGNAGHIEDVRTPRGPEHRCTLCQSRQHPIARGLDHWPTWNKLKYSWKPVSFTPFNIWEVLRWSEPKNTQKRLPL